MTKQLPDLFHNSPIVAEMDELKILRAFAHSEQSHKNKTRLKVIDAKYQPELDRLQNLRNQEMAIQNKIINPYAYGYLKLTDSDKDQVIAKVDAIHKQIHLNINHKNA